MRILAAKPALGPGGRLAYFEPWAPSAGLAGVQGLHSPLCAGVGGLHGEAAGLRNAARHLIESFGTLEEVAEAIRSLAFFTRRVRKHSLLWRLGVNRFVPRQLK